MRIKLKISWLLLPAELIITLIIIFCCFYLFTGYSFLANWYLRMNDVFYHREFWQQDFFTNNVKHQGDLFCGLGLLLGAYLAYVIFRHLKSEIQTLSFHIVPKKWLPVICCLLIATAAWIWGYRLVHEGFDEVFSAVNIAELPVFQRLSYYMLPNNHILFNLLNGFLSCFGNNAVITGKVLSLFCYWGFIILIFTWLSGFIENTLIVIIATILLALQFPVWGFAFEARGYELYLLAGWVCFYAAIKYFRSGNSRWLYIYILAAATGYFCIPTFLYLHSGIILTGILWMLYQRKIDTAFIKCQFYALALVYQLYLPAIAFSGIRSLIANPYVMPKSTGFHQTLVDGVQKTQSYLNYYSSTFTKTHGIIDWILFLFPLILFFFHKNKQAFLLALFYVSLWISCLCLAFGMRNFPLERSLNAHLSISLALTVYSFYLILNKFFYRDTSPLKMYVFFGIILTGFIIYMVPGNKQNVSSGLYNNDINTKYAFLDKEIEVIPLGSTIAFSDECFYLYYLCKKRGDKVSKERSGNEQYFIRFRTDSIPASYSKSYLLVKTVFKKGITATAYEIYKRR